MRYGILALFAAALIGISAKADAARLHYLVGLRHVYRLAYYPDLHENERQQLEVEYAGAVQQAQDQYDQDMQSIKTEEQADGGTHQADRDAVQHNIEQAIEEAAARRDEEFARIYIRADYVLDRHPELAVDQDGPYRVMSVDTGPAGDYVNIVFYRPYPTYVEPCPLGWTWGRSYAYVVYVPTAHRHHEEWVSHGAPVFGSIHVGGKVVEWHAPIRREVLKPRVHITVDLPGRGKGEPVRGKGPGSIDAHRDYKPGRSRYDDHHPAKKSGDDKKKKGG